MLDMPDAACDQVPIVYQEIDMKNEKGERRLFLELNFPTEKDAMNIRISL
jgi:hypothetical protein